MMRELKRDVEIVLVGGDDARALVKGDLERDGDRFPFDEWIEDDREGGQSFLKSHPQFGQFLEVVAGFAQEEEEELRQNSLYLLGCFESFSEDTPESVLSAARQNLVAPDFRSRLQTARLIAVLKDESFFPQARRILVDILVNEEFDRWEAVGAASETFRRLGKPSDEDRQRLEALVAAWHQLIESRGEEGYSLLVKDEKVSRTWDLAASVADYLGQRGSKGGPWRNFEQDLARALARPQKLDL